MIAVFQTDFLDSLASKMMKQEISIRGPVAAAPKIVSGVR